MGVERALEMARLDADLELDEEFVVFCAGERAIRSRRPSIHLSMAAGVLRTKG